MEDVVEEAAQLVTQEVLLSPHQSPSHLCTSWLTWQSRNPGRKRKVRVDRKHWNKDNSNHLACGSSPHQLLSPPDVILQIFDLYSI